MRNFFATNTAMKILSIIAAVIMWLYVMNEQNPQVNYVVKSVPVKLVNLDESRFALKNSSEFTVDVKVRGRRSIVVDLTPDDFNAQVNLKGRIEGDNLIRVDVTVPNNVELIDVSPQEILISLDAIIEKQMPVTVDVNGKTATGFATRDPLVKPDAVVIKGPRSMVNAVDKVVAKIDISNKNSTVISTLPVIVMDGQGREQKSITFRPDVVEVEVPIVPVNNVEVQPNIIGSPLEGYVMSNVTVQPNTVTITGSTELVRKIKKITTESLNVEGRTSSVSADAKLILPDGIEVFDDQLKTVKITAAIEKLVAAKLEIESDKIELKNVSSDLEPQIEYKKIVLTVNGPESIIEKVNEDMIDLSVDVSGLDEGEYILKISAEIASPYTVINIEPDEIMVTLERPLQ